MDIRKVEVFAKVFEHKSFSKAGKALYLSQPTISAHVSSLEEELGIRLFDRIGRTVMPTKAGEVLYQHARAIFAASEQALAELRKLQDRIAGRLDLGGSTIPATYILPDLLAAFCRLYPEVMLDVRMGDSEEIVEQIRDGSLMLGVVGGMYAAPDLDFEPLLHDSLTLVMTPELYAAHAQYTGPDLLRSLTWILREEGSGTRAAVAEGLARVGVQMEDLRCVIVVRNAGAVVRCLLSGMGAAITSYLTVRDEVAAGRLVCVDVAGLSMERSFYVVHNKKRSLFPAALRLIEFLKTHLSETSTRAE